MVDGVSLAKLANRAWLNDKRRTVRVIVSVKMPLLNCHPPSNIPNCMPIIQALSVRSFFVMLEQDWLWLSWKIYSEKSRTLD